MGDVWEEAGAAVVAVIAGSVAAGGLFDWSRRRCGEAIVAAGRLPAPERRIYALVAKPDAGPLSRAQAWDLRAFQQALDDERRDGVLLARHAVPTVRSPADDNA